MNILVTGASGFIGHRFIELAKNHLADGDRLIALSSKSVAGCTVIFHRGYKFSAEDFLCAGVESIDVVVHIGHYVAKERQWDDTVAGNLSSVQSTFHLLKNLPSIPQRFVYCSSSAVYGLHRMGLIDESSGLSPDAFYAGAKCLIETMLKKWAEENSVSLDILRLAHIFGPCGSMENVIDVWLSAAGKDEAIRIFSNPQMVRNWLYIDDCCKMLWRAVYLKANVGIVNVVSRENSTLLRLAELCLKISGNQKGIEIVDGAEERPEETGLQFKNNDKARKYLGGETIGLEEGLATEYRWLIEQGE